MTFNKITPKNLDSDLERIIRHRRQIGNLVGENKTTAKKKFSKEEDRN